MKLVKDTAYYRALAQKHKHIFEPPSKEVKDLHRVFEEFKKEEEELARCESVAPLYYAMRIYGYALADKIRDLLKSMTQIKSKADRLELIERLLVRDKYTDSPDTFYRIVDKYL